MSSPPAEALPATLVGGYLGAGKTTLVNHLLRHAGGRRIAVLVNDFGKVEIDAALIESRAETVISLAGGCLCCSFGDDLVGTLNGLAAGDPRPDALLIELSGVALPGSVARTVRLAPGVEVAGILVLADAAEIRRQAADPYVGDTVRQQLAEADWVLANKPDLAGDAAQRELPGWLATVAPRARVLVCAAEQLAPELLFGWRAAPGRDALSTFAARALGADARAAAVFACRSARPAAHGDPERLGAALAAASSGVLRAKGFARDRAGQGWLLQVAGPQCRVTRAEFSGPGGLVLIGLRGVVDAPGFGVEGLVLDPP
ncbi:MAG: GTP-binding protein [Burkholderiales bacterium]|nr:GTP-binding protein [Burkholderiales bacterium]